MSSVENPYYREQRPERLSEEVLTPTLSGGTPGKPLYDYFYNKLPEGLNKSMYEKGLSCRGFARLIVSELGGLKRARIYWVEEPNPHDKEEHLGHAYVVPVESKRGDLAFNNVDLYLPNKKLKVRDVLSRGVDITEEVFNDQWERL